MAGMANWVSENSNHAFLRLAPFGVELTVGSSDQIKASSGLSR
jgi:hypothetical protein